MGRGNGSSPPDPVKVEFIGLMPTLYAHCQDCMEVMHDVGLKPYEEMLQEYPEEVRELHLNVSLLAQELVTKYGNRVKIDVIDPMSPQGVWKSIRHRIMKTPCVLINRRKVFDYVPSLTEISSKIDELITGPIEVQPSPPQERNR